MANTLPGTPYVESSDLVANYPAVSESLAERIDEVGVLPFADSTARGTALPTPTEGQYSYLQDTNATEYYDGAAWVSLGGGKVLQVVRATDTTQRTTTSTSYIDASISVTITPQKSDSAILIWWLYLADNNAANRELYTRITDSSDNPISGAEEGIFLNSAGRFISMQTLLGYDTPATTSSTTYKGRFRAPSGASVAINNNVNTGQLYAIEVGA